MTSKLDQKITKTEPDTPQPIEADKWLEFTAVLLHDMESPLASMKYLLKLIDEGKLNMEKPLHRQMVASSHIAMGRTESIIYDIMAVAKAGKMGIPCHPSPVQLYQIVREATTMAGGSAQEHGIQVLLSNGPGDLVVTADAGLLKRVLDNLLFNAIRHTPENGNIQVSIEEHSDSAYVHIKDSAPDLAISTPKCFSRNTDN